ncbi:hypothetical protein QQS21_006255 [Conoideocrella luteorostrata]|uniref:Uncharacterized protein n=1 Tax=Conoideocrella luteorostrata TaxID=1105319 RepID=A0AAJ0CN39_9HYPO|nr:hypothetical protein QQS21_006255 [Conoideocrella luteorostrata]
MGDPLDFEDKHPAKRVKISTLPEPRHQYREPKGQSSHQARHRQPRRRDPPRTLWKQEQQSPAKSSRHQVRRRQRDHTASVSSPGIMRKPSDKPISSNSWQNNATTSDTSMAGPSSFPPGTLPSDVLAPRHSIKTDTLVAAPPPVPVAPGSTDRSLSMWSDQSIASHEELPASSPSDSRYPYQPSQINSTIALPIPPATWPAGSASPSISVKSEHTTPNTTNGANNFITTPFNDCLGSFGLHHSLQYSRPADGQVNGYVKFAWMKFECTKSFSVVGTPSFPHSPRIVELDGDSDSAKPEPAAERLPVAFIEPQALPVDSSNGMVNCPIGNSKFVSQSAPTGYSPCTPTKSTPSPDFSNDSWQVASMGAPKLVPSQYGYEIKMDYTDRRFWMFYIRNWCPGRSILQDTNLWLKDFAQMHKSVGVLSAIQSLAGAYIYDYQPLKAIQDRVNQRFHVAEHRLATLLNDPFTRQDEAQANELITIAVILSMQDIVLIERRKKKPDRPRWIKGFSCGEKFLEATDHGSRFWKTSNVQTSSLRISQSVIVGRAIILAQPMSSLPDPDTFDAHKEASRFGWLLYGTESDMFQIHGGCGFSRKLLHVLSQITYCAARLQQHKESPVVPMTADFLHRKLLSMRQWSPETKDWESAKALPPLIDWVRIQSQGYIIRENSIMTDVTAEAWRIAAILYLLCRVLRLPRHHKEVISHVDDLARCIMIMPTSGSQFTAQAPLFPVFLLGILATDPGHQAVSRNWFDQVVQTPVRSSVPPLYTTLKNIWSWIDNEIPQPLQPNLATEQPIYLRPQWWEMLVMKVEEKGEEFLCLT